MIVEPGDIVTITGTVRKVYGPGPTVAVIDVGAELLTVPLPKDGEPGVVWVPLPQDGQLPDGGIVVTHAPRPAVEQHVGGTS